MNYLRNVWYVAAWDFEVNGTTLLSRRFLDEPVVLFRDSAGVGRALSDRCPHRFAPLSLGKLADGVVQCAYHGLCFDGSGACVHNPHGGQIPGAARTHAYPLVERYSVLWIWMGDPALADPALIPDFSCMDPDAWFVGKRYLHVKANYLLENDNILDLSHIEYLHPGTLGGAAVNSAISRIEQNGNTVWAYRQTVAEVMTEFLYKSMGLPSGIPVDRWFDVRWDPPANLLLFAGATPTGSPRDQGPQTLFPHLFTPETQVTTHYWFSACYPRAMGEFGAQLAEQVAAAVEVPFRQEDLPMLERQQQSMGDADFWALKPVLLGGDASAIRARRILEKMMREEPAKNASVARAGAL